MYKNEIILKYFFNFLDGMYRFILYAYITNIYIIFKSYKSYIEIIKPEPL